MKKYTSASSQCGSGLSSLNIQQIIFSSLIFLLCLFPSSLLAASTDANTIFIPPKINAALEQETVTASTDQTLRDILQQKGISMVGRSEAEQTLDYAVWPPKPETLTPLLPASGIEFVTTGSVTKFGEQFSFDFVVYDLFGGASPKYFYKVSMGQAELNMTLNQLLGEILSYSGRYFLLDSVTVAGNTRTDTGAIMRQVKSQAGDKFSARSLRSDLNNIFKMGYFDDVQIHVTDSEKGKKITFQVVEKAVIGQVIIDGEDELEEKEISEVISVTPNTIINPKEVQNSVENIRKLYKEKGFYRSKVSAKLNYAKADRVNVRFKVEEGIKIYIKDIRFVGNEAFKSKELKKSMATEEKDWLSWITDSGKLKRDLLEQDRSRIGAKYHNSGFIEAKISEPKITYEGDGLVITFNISEGQRFRVGTIEIDGDIVGDKNDLFGLVKLSEEKFFSRKTLREDVLRLTDRYAEKGYAFAEVNPRMRKNMADKRMDVEINVEKGSLVHVNRIVIKGNSRTRDKVIRRQMKVKEGEILDASAVRKSSERLQRLDFFEEVSVTPEQTVQDNIMDVVVDVKEKATGTFSIGGGYSSVDSVMFMGEVSENNFLGKGQKLALQANLSSSSTRYNLNFTEPHLNDTKLLFGYDIYNWSRDYDDYDKDSTGFALRFGYPIYKRWKLGFGYGFDDTKLTDVLDTASQEIKDAQEIATTSYIKLGVSHDTRNRYRDTSEGAVHSLSMKQAGGLLGGDSFFSKYEGSTSWYFPFHWDTVFHVKGAMGYAMEHEDKKLPVYEKFYLGGLSTIRGFDSGKISPTALADDGTLDRVGGEKMWFGNFEWIFPLVKDLGLKGLVFFDTGNVYADSETWDPGDLKKSVGFGFRWMSPMGPLRLEYGINLDPEDDEDTGVWDFSMGGSF